MKHPFIFLFYHTLLLVKKKYIQSLVLLLKKRWKYFIEFFFYFIVNIFLYRCIWGVPKFYNFALASKLKALFMT